MRTKKKDYGQFFTDPIIAKFMTDLVVDDNTNYFLDPAVGMGVFPQCANMQNQSMQISACEIDPEMILEFKKHNSYSYRLVEEDYLKCEFDRKFDAIICNPPYNKFQEIHDRNNLIKDFEMKYNIRLSGYSNLCVYFLIKSMNELNANGKGCYIIPYEFMNAGYGSIIKKYLINSRMLKSIYKFNNSLNLFNDAITTSCILFFENSNHSSIEFINIDDISDIEHGVFSQKKEYNYSELDPDQKWLQYFEFSQKCAESKNIVEVSTFGKVSRGIATGSNKYFALNKSMIKALGLSDDVCMPCITKAPDVSDLVFTDLSYNRLYEKDKKVFLFNGAGASCESDYNYIKKGETDGVDKAYLTSHRSPWYLIEEKKPAPIWVSVFSRDKLKIIRNESGIRNLTTFHGFYLYNNKSDFANIMFCYLLTPVAQELLLNSRREYGDGLTKFEPNDLTKAKMLDLRLICDQDEQEILSIYNDIKVSNNDTGIDELDKIFRKYL